MVLNWCGGELGLWEGGGTESYSWSKLVCLSSVTELSFWLSIIRYDYRQVSTPIGKPDWPVRNFPGGKLVCPRQFKALWFIYSKRRSCFVCFDSAVLCHVYCYFWVKLMAVNHSLHYISVMLQKTCGCIKTFVCDKKNRKYSVWPRF